ncbi:MAG: hypothetical protein KHZ77_06415 [Veillonella sp.]|uniref:hypothetical protein n=1 Tax=Veillonella sp. TaxID=1926307 RepID=UPI0025E2CD29|nr:hypothetical protein [Veillonella sp.]MBS4913785.1 hypothetical protein [Veillonella sp.]
MVSGKAREFSDMTWGVEAYIRNHAKGFKTAGKVILCIVSLMIVMGYLGSCKKAEEKEYGGAHSTNQAVTVQLSESSMNTAGK